MIVPFITAVLRDVFSLVPPMLKESAYGLGATWEVVRNIVIPHNENRYGRRRDARSGARAGRNDGGDVCDW